MWGWSRFESTFCDTTNRQGLHRTWAGPEERSLAKTDSIDVALDWLTVRLSTAHRREEGTTGPRIGARLN